MLQHGTLVITETCLLQKTVMSFKGVVGLLLEINILTKENEVVLRHRVGTM